MRSVLATGNPEQCTLTYNTMADTWSQGACLAQARAQACAAVVNGKVRCGAVLCMRG